MSNGSRKSYVRLSGTTGYYETDGGAMQEINAHASTHSYMEGVLASSDPVQEDREEELLEGQFFIRSNN